ncbi:MAG: hypothetical protein QF362_02915 [Candidatus Woesearchaeota archaeon]|jgi:hypothetical protein|nr:hypothetical protein [Candidatus Woesearchaeota archaeon]MDP7506369.1 hypothetical protein [Candidatus Woesearchaeota archaeon]|tara:strand:+ start:777 stop:1052 length:276 start_codon:yes stop_codon:yes gene_type:complete
MVKKILLVLIILLIIPISYAESIDSKINSIVKYGEQYEMGQISYLQMIVHSNALRQEINEMLSEKIEIKFEEHIEYGATEEEMRKVTLVEH